MKKPRIQNFISYEDYRYALLEFEEACRNGDKQAIASDINNKYFAKKRQEKYERWKKRMSKNKIFCDGLRVTEKQISQDFLIIKLGIKANDFMDFIAKYTNERGYVNIDIKTSKGGKLYAELNTYGMSETDATEEEENMNFEELPF